MESIEIIYVVGNYYTNLFYTKDCPFVFTKFSISAKLGVVQTQQMPDTFQRIAGDSWSNQHNEKQTSCFTENEEMNLFSMTYYIRRFCEYGIFETKS